MEIKNGKSASLTDYLSIGNSSKSLEVNKTFDSILEKTDTVKFQKDSQKHYLKDKVKDKVKNNFADESKNVDKKDIIKPKNISNNTENVDTSDNIKSLNESTKSSTDTKVTKEENVDTANESEKIEKNDDAINVVKNLSPEDESVKEIATLLNITPEKLVEVLNTLNLEISDLTETENVTKLLVEVNELANKFDLLTIPNLKEALEKIKNVAEEATNETNTKENAPIETSAVKTTEMTSDAQSRNTSSETTSNNQNEANLNTNSQVMTKAFIDTFEQNVESEDSEILTQNEQVNTENADIEVTGPAVNTLNTSNNGEMAKGATTVQNNDTLVINGQNAQTEASFVSQASKALGNTRPVSQEDIIRQLTDAMKVEIKSDISNEIKITLRPQHLGDVTLKIMTDNGIVTAQFEAQNQRVKEIIESNFNQLKDSLQSQGIEISNLQVNVNENNQPSAEFSNGNHRNGNSQNAQNGDNILEEDIPNEVYVDRDVALGSTNSFLA